MRTVALFVLEKQINVNASYLSKTFRAEVGMPITDYVNARKVETAAKLLCTITMQLAELASYVGVNDLYYFSKMVKKYQGCTPGQY